MAGRISLRDYQRELAARLRSAVSGGTVSKLGLQIGEESWLVDLADLGEVIQVPVITAVPLTRAWFRGAANIRGNLYSVVDFPAFLGGAPIKIGEEARLLVISERFRMSSALLIDRSLGLRNPAQLQQRPACDDRPPWAKAEYTDQNGRAWKELDMLQLVRHPDFVGVSS